MHTCSNRSLGDGKESTGVCVCLPTLAFWHCTQTLASNFFSRTAVILLNTVSTSPDTTISYFFTFVKRLVRGWRILAVRYKFAILRNYRKLFIFVDTQNYRIVSVLAGDVEVPVTPIRWPKNITSAWPNSHLIGLITIPYSLNLS